ncbi:hypothetical protein [Hymenobacter negativus]|uniref:STAS/SEC14 domain-containing protein n=1 Tax=Hymenobacter negativus TaxID=2795026 RepID=A0ABS3Q9W4_9BACT|nr:hypothetical protein [Hymenobacter negativus]MBO2007926.1 hypothetical protein [Hymenobacter negativus]
MNLPSRTPETLFFQNAAGKLYYQPGGFVRLSWSADRAPFDVLKAYYAQVLALMQSTGTRKILSEHGQRSPLSGPAQQWLTGEWIPQAIREARARYCAIVEGSDPMHRLSTQSVVSSSPSGLIFQRFNTIEAAENWLLAVDLSK